MNSSISSPPPFEITYIKNAKVIKTEIKPFLHNIVYNYIQPLSFENEPYSLETIPLIREHLNTYLFYIRHRSATASTEYPSFQITFPQQETSSRYRRTINPINLQIPIKEVFHAFLNRVKEYNSTIENPQYSPNALEELERYIPNFEVHDIERLIITQNNLHHWLQADILRIQNFLYHYLKDITLNEQTIPQTKVISLFLRKYFRFNYKLLWSEQDQPAFAAFHNHFTADECLPFIINQQNEHPYFFKPDKVTQQTMDLISFDPHLITENNFHDDNRPYRYEQNIQEQQNLFTNNDNDNEEDDNNNEEYILEKQNENRDEDIVLHTNENNTSEYTTPESTTSAQNASQTEVSTISHFVRIPTRVVSPRQKTHDPQSYLDTSSHRNITFNLPTHSDEVVQDESQNITSTRDTSVNVYHLQVLFLIIHKIQLDLFMTLHQFLLLFKSRIKQIILKKIVIITNKRLVNTMKQHKQYSKHFST